MGLRHDDPQILWLINCEMFGQVALNLAWMGHIYSYICRYHLFGGLKLFFPILLIILERLEVKIWFVLDSDVRKKPRSSLAGLSNVRRVKNITVNNIQNKLNLVIYDNSLHQETYFNQKKRFCFVLFPQATIGLKTTKDTPKIFGQNEFLDYAF